VSARHLHRTLVAEVGVGPLALARTRRAQTARLLIDQTTLPLTTISGTAGFTSIRQFNETMRASFGCTPTEMRRRGPQAPGGGGLVLRLHYRPPLDAAALLAYLAHRAVAGVEEVVDGRYRRTVALPHARGVVELEPLADANAVLLRLCLDDLRDLGPLVQRCRQLLDLDADPAAIGAALGTDPLLAPLVAARPGLRVPGAIDGFELAVRAILGQQVSVAGARTLAGRLVAALGAPLPEPRGALTHTFPTPERVAGTDLKGLGLTGGRIVALRALARAVTEGDLTLDRGADWERTLARLRALPGIGPWTASYIAMCALGDPDACPVADLGLRRALERQGLAGDPKAIAARAEAWRPWRAYATHHLWASLAIPSEAG
jgi:AraC family transcriptional regulator of adaptative response / DNA-3-methyladenine glycosylase II